MEYNEASDETYDGAQGEVHQWRPPCSCGIELSEAREAEESSKADVHLWRPPCSCGVSLDDACN